MSYKKLIEVKPLEGYEVFIKFEDGKSGKVSFKDDVEIGVFKKLKESDNFKKTKIDWEGSSLTWEIDVPELERPDSSSEWLYTQIS